MTSIADNNKRMSIFSENLTSLKRIDEEFEKSDSESD